MKILSLIRSKRVLSALLACILFLTGCFSKSEPKRNSYIDESWEEGVYFGRNEILMNLWVSIPDEYTTIMRHCDDVWETDYFTVQCDTITTEVPPGASYDPGQAVTIHFTSRKYTTEECFLDNKLFFNILARGNGTRPLIVGEDFYAEMYVEDLDTYSGSASIGVNCTDDALLFIISVDGRVFRGLYYIKKP